uniref:Uncharacterized protein n=1 Tax=Avena sativa TaxID=4498 RepID=A0ACD5XG87_AVESA
MALRPLRHCGGGRQHFRLLRTVGEPGHLHDGAAGPFQRRRRLRCERLVGDGQPHAPAGRLRRRFSAGPLPIHHTWVHPLRPGTPQTVSSRLISICCIFPSTPHPRWYLGYGMITIVSMLHDDKDLSSMLVASFYASLYLIAIARGIDKPCGVAFAADQFEPDHPRERVARSSLFNWWYFSIAIGMAAAIAVISYIQENVGWGIGFGMLCVIMLCSFVVFLLGSPTYRIYAPTPGNESPFTRLVCGFAVLVKNSSFPFGAREDDLREEEDDEAAVTRSEEARTVLRLLLIWAACLAYGVVFAQIMTFFNKQGRTLDRRIFGGLVLPPAALQTFTPVSILVFVPLYDRVLVPALHRTTGNPTGLTLLQRVGMGMAVSLTAVCVAALVEGRRLETAQEHGLVDDAGATVPMSWVWLVPQYAMVGVADVFAMIGMQEFFYDQMPSELRSLGLGLYYSVIGMGGFISGGIISLIDRITTGYGGDSWFADNLNHAHLDYFYWLLAAISAAELALFIRLASSYAYRNKVVT